MRGHVSVGSKADLTALKCDFRYTPEVGHSRPWLRVAVSDLSGTKLRTSSCPSVLTAGGTP
jgi:hypothetical protein